MNKIQLLKEPGYIYDLYFIFYLKFNTQLYIDSFPSSSKKEENAERVKEILNRFNDIPEDLYVFFHAIKTGRTCLPSRYFVSYKNLFPTTYNFKFLQKELSDHGKLIRNVIRFYFHELDDETVEQCASSLNKIFPYIKSSDYSDEEKARLYEFFLEPEPYIQTLQYELMSKEFMLSEYYRDNYQKILDIYNQTTYELLCEQMEGIEIEYDTFNTSDQVMYTSYCLLNRFCISFYFLDSGCLSLLGYDYINHLDLVKEGCKEIDLCSLGTALCEESRVKILNFLLERGEATCKDLEKEFSFSGSTAYHHITIMTKAGLIKIRNRGKTILYSLNEKYINSIINTFTKFLNKK